MALERAHCHHVAERLHHEPDTSHLKLVLLLNALLGDVGRLARRS